MAGVTVATKQWGVYLLWALPTVAYLSISSFGGERKLLTSTRVVEQPAAIPTGEDTGVVALGCRSGTSGAQSLSRAASNDGGVITAAVARLGRLEPDR